MAKATVIPPEPTQPSITLELTASEARTLLQIVNLTTFAYDRSEADNQSRNDILDIWRTLRDALPEQPSDKWARWASAPRAVVRALTWEA